MSMTFGTLLEEREKAIIDKMVLKYRSGKGTFEEYHADVAVISELRTLRDRLERDTLEAIEETDAH